MYDCRENAFTTVRCSSRVSEDYNFCDSCEKKREPEIQRKETAAAPVSVSGKYCRLCRSCFFYRVCPFRRG